MRDILTAHQAVYLWCSMLWPTSTSGACIITKQNVVSETIAFMFLVFWLDIPKPCHSTSEPAEHMFGMLCLIVCEFTCLEFAQVVVKQICPLTQIYKNHFCPSQDPNKGYQATHKKKFDCTCDASVGEGLMDVTVTLLNDGGYVASQTWAAVRKAIYTCLP
eukprot:943108-Ditylum_brightwellii.AAC.1